MSIGVIINLISVLFGIEIMVASVLSNKNQWNQHIQIGQVDDIRAGCVGEDPATLLPVRGSTKASHEPIKVRTQPVHPYQELVVLICPPRIGQHGEHRHPREVKTTKVKKVMSIGCTGFQKSLR